MSNTITPDTVSYLYLGLAAIAALTGGFVVSLVLRYRKAVSELRRLNDE